MTFSARVPSVPRNKGVDLVFWGTGKQEERSKAMGELLKFIIGFVIRCQSHSIPGCSRRCFVFHGECLISKDRDSSVGFELMVRTINDRRRNRALPMHRKSTFPVSHDKCNARNNFCHVYSCNEQYLDVMGKLKYECSS